jgi:rhamnosyltransferase
LTTFNSDKYLKELIDSIICQTYQDWALYVRDDGSSDCTVEVIKEYCQLNSNKVFLIQDEIANRGPKGGFMYLMEQVESDYYMFCDHDDVWMPGKIEATLSKMVEHKEFNNIKPILVHTDLIVVDESLNTLNPSFWKFSHASPKNKSFVFHCAYNNITGCTMLFNRLTRDLSLPAPKEIYLHDKWVALVVSFHRGIIDYVKESTILYRQHTNNALGARKIPSFARQLCNLKDIMQRNKNQYKAICHLQKKTYAWFLINKSFYFFALRLKMFF